MTRGPRYLDARLHFLGRQVLDRHDVPVTVVDDLEIAIGNDATPARPDQEPVDVGPARVTSLVSGQTLFTRIFGGRPPSRRRQRIRWTDVGEVGLVIRLDRTGEDLDQTWPERWIRDHIIGRIPGAGHPPE